MKPENVNPGNFELIEIIYDNNEFSIAYGIFEKGNKCIGMRWNGDVNNNNDKVPESFQKSNVVYCSSRLDEVITKRFARRG